MKEIKRKCWFARNLITLKSCPDWNPQEDFIFTTKPELMRLLCGEVVQSGTILNVAELVKLKKGERRKMEIIIRESK